MGVEKRVEFTVHSHIVKIARPAASSSGVFCLRSQVIALAFPALAEGLHLAIVRERKPEERGVGEQAAGAFSVPHLVLAGPPVVLLVVAVVHLELLICTPVLSTQLRQLLDPCAERDPKTFRGVLLACAACTEDPLVPVSKSHVSVMYTQYAYRCRSVSNHAAVDHIPVVGLVVVIWSWWGIVCCLGHFLERVVLL